MGKKAEAAPAPKGRRVYVQVTSPKTGRSTTVILPFRFVGEVGTKEMSTPAGKRVVGYLVNPANAKNDLTPVDLGSFESARRQSVALAARRHPDWVGVPEAKPEPPAKAKKGAPAARSKPKRSKAAPKAPRARKAAGGAPATAPAAHGTGPTVDLTAGGSDGAGDGAPAA